MIRVDDSKPHSVLFIIRPGTYEMEIVLEGSRGKQRVGGSKELGEAKSWGAKVDNRKYHEKSKRKCKRERRSATLKF